MSTDLFDILACLLALGGILLVIFVAVVVGSCVIAWIYGP